MVDYRENEGPELGIDEIMGKIREEVARRRQQYSSKGMGQFSPHDLTASASSGHDAVDFSAIRSSISAAGAHAEVGTEVTPMLHFPAPIRGVAQLIGRIVLYLSSFITFKQRNFNRAVITAMRTIADSMERTSGEIFRVLEDRLVVAAAIRSETEALRKDQAAVRGEIEALRGDGEALKKEQRMLDDKIIGEESIILNKIREQKLELLNLQLSFRKFLEKAEISLKSPSCSEKIKSLESEENHLLDAMYVSFEDRFRGTREDIKNRLSVYLPYIEQTKVGAKNAPILDLGCGRGEWLELLKDYGYAARGVDLNRIMIAQCHSFGLDVTESDAIDFLKKHEPDTFSVITGFHFVEHLPLKNLIELFDESRRVLRPGGMVIFETPNPENLIVGAFTFYLDPSHGRPIVPDSLEFIARERGFIETFILRLHKFSDFHDIKETEDEFKKRWFYSETDYAILCYKAL